MEGAGHIIKKKDDKKPSQQSKQRTAQQSKQDKTTEKAVAPNNFRTTLSHLWGNPVHLYKSSFSILEKKQSMGKDIIFTSENTQSITEESKSSWKEDSLKLFNEVVVNLYPKDDDMQSAKRHWQRYKLYRYADTILKAVLSKIPVWQKTETQFIPKALNFLKSQDWRFYVPKEQREVDLNPALAQPEKITNPLSQSYYHEQMSLQGQPQITYVENVFFEQHNLSGEVYEADVVNTSFDTESNNEFMPPEHQNSARSELSNIANNDKLRSKFYSKNDVGEVEASCDEYQSNIPPQLAIWGNPLAYFESSLNQCKQAVHNVILSNDLGMRQTCYP